MSIDNPRQEAGEHELWFSPSRERVYSDEAGNRWTWARVNSSSSLPADAVKLGDVEALRVSFWEAAKTLNRIARAEAEARFKVKARADRTERERDEAVELVADLNARLLQGARERDALRADYQAAQAVNAPLKRQLDDIRAVLDDPKYAAPKSGREVHRNNDDKLDRIEAILDREPGREEPAKFLPIRKADVEAEILPGRNLGDDMERRRPAFKAWVQAEMIARAESEPGRNE